MRPLPEFDTSGRRMAGYTIEFRTRGRWRRCCVWAASSEDAIAIARRTYHCAVGFRSLTRDPPSSPGAPGLPAVGAPSP